MLTLYLGETLLPHAWHERLQAERHFITTPAVVKHYTCVVLDVIAKRNGNPLWSRPMRLALRLWNGLIQKSFYVWLDGVLISEDNTSGWIALCIRRK